jgi:hypothetical protein
MSDQEYVIEEEIVVEPEVLEHGDGDVEIVTEYDDGDQTVEEAVAGIGTSVIRTFIPAIVGAIAAVVVGWAAAKGWDVSEEQIAAYATPFTIAAYYAGVRWLEVNVNANFGKLLGKATAPVYPAG